MIKKVYLIHSDGDVLMVADTPEVAEAIGAQAEECLYAQAEDSREDAMDMVREAMTDAFVVVLRDALLEGVGEEEE